MGKSGGDRTIVVVNMVHVMILLYMDCSPDDDMGK